MKRNKAIITILTIIILVLILVIAFLIYSKGKIVGKDYGAFTSGNPFTEEQLKTGVKCKQLMWGGISNGFNTEDVSDLFGTLKKSKATFDENDYDFYLRVNDEGQFVESNPKDPNFSDREKVYEMFSDQESGVYHNTKGNPDSDYLFLTGKGFRSFSISYVEGSGISMAKGVCFK